MHANHAYIVCTALCAQITTDIPKDGERNRNQASTGAAGARGLLSIPTPSLGPIAWGQEALISTAGAGSAVAAHSRPELPVNAVADLEQALEGPSRWTKLVLHVLTVLVLPLAWLTWRHSQQAGAVKGGPSAKKLRLPVSISSAASDNQLQLHAPTHSCNSPTHAPATCLPPLLLPPIATRSSSQLKLLPLPQLSSAQHSPHCSIHAPFSAFPPSSMASSTTGSSLSTSRSLSMPDTHLLSPARSSPPSLLSPTGSHPFLAAEVPLSRGSSTADHLRPSRSSSLRDEEVREATCVGSEEPWVSAHISTAPPRAHYQPRNGKVPGASRLGFSSDGRLGQ